MDFWCHIVVCSKISIQLPRFISSFNRCCKPKISQLENKLTVQKKVLWFQISMSYSLLMAVLKSIHEFNEVMTSDSFFKSACHGNEIKEFSTFCQFKHNIVNFLRSILFNIVSSAKLNCLYNIYIFQLVHSFNFCHEQFFLFLAHIIIHYLDGHLLFCF